MAYPVMVVDDKPYVRQMLRHLGHWEQYGFYIAAECINGQEALERLRSDKTPFALCISDIRMPLMDGLEFIRLARQEFKDLLFVVISAYDDFQQVRQALLLGVEDYLLKSEMTSEDIDRLLEKISGILNQRRDTAREDQLAPALRELLMYGLHQRANRSMDSYVPIRESLTQRALAVACFHYAGPAQQADAGWQTLGQILEQEAEEGTAFAALRTHTREGYVLLSLRQDGARRASQLLRTVHNAMNAQEYLMNTGLSEVFYDPKLIGEMLESAAIACDACFLRGNGLALTHSGRKENGPRITLDVDQRLNLLKHAMNEVPRQPLPEYREKLIGGFEEATVADIAAIKELFLRYAYVLEERIGAKKYPESVRLRCLEVKTLLHSYADMRTMEDWLYRMLVDIRAEETTKSVAERMIYYIDQHYQEDLSLNTLAASFHVSPSHASRLFKQQVSMNFGDYLAKVRIQKALELMRRSDLKLYEIAEQVGYHSQEHFCRVFKLVLGESPKRYMSRMSS